MTCNAADNDRSGFQCSSGLGELQYRWIVLIIVWMAYLATYLARLGIGPMAPFLKEAFDLSNKQIGNLVSASVISHAPTLMLGGWLVDRIGPKLILVIGTMITALCFMLLFFASSYEFMIAILILSGFGTGCIFPSIVKAIMQWFSAKERGLALGINQTAINVSGLFGACLLPLIAISFGWEYGFLFMGVGVIIIWIFVIIFYKDNIRIDISSKNERNRERNIKNQLKGKFLSEILNSKNIWMIGLSGFFFVIVEFGILTYLLVFLRETFYFDVVTAGFTLAITEASGAIGKPVSGLASDRLFNGRRKPVFLIMASASSVLCLLIGMFGENLGLMLFPVFMILGVMAIGWGGLYATLAGEAGGRELAGATSGTSASILVIGIIVGPPIIGYVADKTGSFQSAWFVMAMFAILSVVFALFIREGRRLS